jgi:hypothetical protein
VKWRKIHELSPWDERGIFRLREGEKMRGNHSGEEWQRILADHRLPPPAPAVRVSITAEAIELFPDVAVGQLELGAIAAGLAHWVISNARDVYDPLLPFRLFSLIGRDAFTKPNSWRRRLYAVPVVLRGSDQVYQLGWEGLCTALAADLSRAYSVAEIARLGDRAILATLSGPEAHDFRIANR